MLKGAGIADFTRVRLLEVGLWDAIQEHSVPNLSVLTCGALPPNPSELLQSQAMGEVLTRLRAEYDVIIIDAPPLLPVTDAALLASQSDGALVVVRHGKTTRDQLRHAIERLDSVDARALGVVLNMVPKGKSGDSYYGYGYGYGYAPETGRRARKPQSEATPEETTSLEEMGFTKP